MLTLKGVLLADETIELTFQTGEWYAVQYIGESEPLALCFDKNAAKLLIAARSQELGISANAYRILKVDLKWLVSK